MSSCPFRRQKSANRLLDESSPVRQESVGTQDDEDDGQTLNLKVLHEAVRFVVQPRVSLKIV